MSYNITEEDLRNIAKFPHLIGHIVGKTKLTKMHSKWIRDAWTANDHYSMQAHRGAYKTTALTEVGCIWWLLFHPNDRIGLVRKPYTEAQKTLFTVRRYLEHDGIKALFAAAHGIVPKAVVQKENSLTYNFKKSITKEGSIDAHGIDGNLTGNHYDKIICDDIVTLKDRLSAAEREKTKEQFREILTNIIDPGKQVINVGTPWHKEDAHALLPPQAIYDCYTTGVLTAEDLEKKRVTTTPVLFAANYELRHTSTADLIFGEVSAQEPWDFSHGIANIYAHIDAKFSGSHYGALTIMARRLDRKIQAKGWTFENHVEDELDKLIERCKQYRVKKIYIENNPDKGYTAKLLRSRIADKRYMIAVHEYAESMNKTMKIVTHLKGQWPNIVWDLDCEDTYLSMITDYREDQEPDDAPDSAASLIRAEFPAAESSDLGLYIL